jgi:hypothetical protein
MMPDVWFRDADQRAGDYHFEVLVSPDGMRAQYRSTHLPTDTLQIMEFTGETSAADADRRFTERVIKEVHG